MTRSDDELVVRAAAASVAQLPKDAVARLGDERVFTLLAAVTTETIHRRFATKPESEAVRSYVAELKERFPDGAELIKPIVAEALIRYAFGEDDILEGAAIGDIRTLLFVLPYAIITELGIEGDHLDALVTKVITAADEPE